MEYQHPLMTEKLTETQKIVNELIQSTQKEISPKTLEVSPVWSPILL
jgi:hypothetical protein